MTQPDNIEHPEPVLLASVPTAIEAKLIVDALANDNVTAMTTGEEAAGFRDVVPGLVRILVHKNDLTQAQKILNDFVNDKETDIDWDSVDLGQLEE